MKLSRFGTVLSVALLGVVTGCGSEPADPSDSGTTTSGSTEPADLDGSWVLRSGMAGTGPLEIPPDVTVTLEVDGVQVSGTSGCNRYFGTVTVTGESVQFGGLGGTEMGCDADVMALETAYLQTLAEVRTASVSGAGSDAELLLSSKDVGLTYERAPEVADTALVGTTWTLDSVLSSTDPDGSASTPVGQVATLVLADDGTFTAETGCRQVLGSYTLDGANVSTSDLVETDVLCPPDTVDQDEQVRAILAGFDTEIDGAMLTIVGADGRGLVYRAEGPGS